MIALAGQFHDLCVQIDAALDANDLTAALRLNERARLAAIAFYSVRSPRSHSPMGSGPADSHASASPGAGRHPCPGSNLASDGGHGAQGDPGTPIVARWNSDGRVKHPSSDASSENED